ncbi:MAG: enoyl-CoA hydratase-related protein [Acidobacteriota bacterium]
MSSFETLKYEHHGAVASVVLSRPDVHDAFDETVIAELTQVFGQVAQAFHDRSHAPRVVVLRSTGRHFSAGADLRWMQAMADKSEDENKQDALALAAAFEAIASCPVPVIARVQGAALGGGAGLATAAHLAVASTRARFGFTEVRLGILPAVISPHVINKLGPGPAQALFLTGERFDAERAMQLGLVHRVVEDTELDDAVERLVHDLLQGSPQAQAEVGPLVRAVTGKSLEEANPITAEAIARARASTDGREGLAAFLEKRKPAWATGEEDA